MTMKPISILTTLALAGLMLQPMDALAQRSTAVAPSPAARRAPAPAPTPSTGAAPAAARSTAAAAWNDQEYRLGPGDKLRVEVYGESQLSQSLQVRPDGRITLPLIGDLRAATQTPAQLREAITTSLKDYITNPVVTVIVQEAVAAQIYVIGEVLDPGVQVMQGPLTVLQALAQAGGLKEFADKGDIHILRQGPGGRPQPIPFNYKDAMKGRIEPMQLQPGDTVVVP